jgi:hypothetical protein
MKPCYLCKNESIKTGRDFGRRDVFDCKECGIYEVGPAAAAILAKPEFPKARRMQITQTVVAINKAGAMAEIVFDGENLTVRAMP